MVLIAIVDVIFKLERRMRIALVVDKEERKHFAVPMHGVGVFINHGAAT